MKLRILSDTHLEGYEGDYSRVISKINCTFDNVSADEVLVMPGDLGMVTNEDGEINPSYEKFLRFVKTKWNHVILVPGNTEYHGMTNINSLVITEDVLKKVCDGLGIHYLQKDIMKIDDTYVLGCTLWKFTNQKEWKELPEEDREIFMDNEIYKMSYVDNLEWMYDTLTKIKTEGGKALVVTHYPPITSYKELKFKWYKDGEVHYSDHIQHFMWMFKDTIKAWVCGHVHDKSFIEIAHVPVYLNSMGESDENYKLSEGLVII
jgi:predicted phosphohydrolase